MPSEWSTLFTECKRFLMPLRSYILFHLQKSIKGLENDRFGIEFAPEVVQADGNVRNISWRICNAKKVLVYFTSSPPSYYKHVRRLTAGPGALYVAF